MFGTHFYNRIIRKCVVAFGTLFKNISVVRYTSDGQTSKERFRVPLNYGPKETYMYKILQDPDLLKSILISLPRISFEITGFKYDTTRKLQSTLTNFGLSANQNKIKKQYVPVPYDVDFSLSVYVRNHEDGTQIIEQILPYFTPDYTLSVVFEESIEKKYDFPVILNDVSQQIDYEGDNLTSRLIVWTLNFTVKMWIFGPTTEAKLIMGIEKDPIGNIKGEPGNTYTGGATVRIYNDINRAPVQKLFLVDSGSTVNFVQSEIVRSRENNLFGYVENFDRVNKIIYVSQANGIFEPDMIIRGDYSNAVWTIQEQMISSANTLLVTTSTVQNPLSSYIDDDFGFNTTITEYEPY